MSNGSTGPAFGPGDEQTWPPCANHPNDPRTPEPPPFDSLTEAEKRAELATLSTRELVDMILALAEDVVRWENRARLIADILGVKP